MSEIHATPDDHGIGWLVSQSAQIQDPSTHETVQGFVWTLVLSPAMLPPEQLHYLPFAPEPYDSWHDGTDVFAFAKELFVFTSHVIGLDGRAGAISNHAYAPSALIPQERQRIEEVLDSFEEVVDARLSSDLGRALKHDLGWRVVAARMLQESTFFSLPHLLEAQRDLDCCLLLAARGYYKQSSLVLRSFIEATVMPLHFRHDPIAFEKWKRNSYRVPSLRGGKGILVELVAANLIDATLAQRTASVYGTLSGAVHGAESELAHSGVFRGARTMPKGSSERLGNWCALYTECADVGTRLLVAGGNKWAVMEGADLFCNSCHNRDPSKFALAKLEFGDRCYDRIRCERCKTAQVRQLHHARDEPVTPWEFPGVQFTREPVL